MKPLSKLLLFVIIFATCFSVVHGQLREERAKRLSKSGRLVTTDSEFFPARKTTGEIASTTINTAQADFVKGLRLHFVFNADKVREAGQAGTWRVEVNSLSGNDEPWVFDSKLELDTEEFWSIQFAGNGVDVKVFSDVPNSALKLKCDQRIEYSDPIQEKSMVGEDNTIALQESTDPNFREWGRSVAKLTFVTDEDKEVETCTGFLIGADLFITNEHCPQSPKEQRSSLVEFDYDTPSAQTKIYSLKAKLAKNRNLDFVIYQLNKSIKDRPFLKLMNKDENLTDKKPLVIIQHPAGLPKRLAAVKCQIRTTALQPATDFGHECDTEGGASGAPIQDVNGIVVGIHHYGFNMDLPPEQRVNQGVKMGEILKYLEGQKKELFKRLLSSSK
jgi:V8-like Glu-specific endopeptidase